MPARARHLPACLPAAGAELEVILDQHPRVEPQGVQEVQAEPLDNLVPAAA